MVEGNELIDQSNYLDIPNIVFNELIGNPWLAFAIGAIIIVLVSMKYSIPLEAVIIIMIIFSAAMFIMQGYTLLLILIALIVILIVYPKIAQVFRNIGG